MEKYIERWRQKGLIDSETSQKLIEDMESERVRILKLRFNIFVYTVAAICIGIGVFGFVSANTWILKLFSQKPIIRVISLFSLSILSLVSGYVFAYKRGNFPRLGRSLIFLSSILFGISYALIWKTYHIKQHYDVMMFLWLFSILPIAYKFQNRFVNRLSILVFLCGCCGEFLKYEINFYFIFPMLVGSFLYTIGNTSKQYEEFFADYKATGFALIFLALLGMAIFDLKTHSVNTFVHVFLIFLICCNLWLCNKQPDIFEKRERLLLSCILFVTVGMFAFPKLPVITSVCIANVLIIAILWVGFKEGYEKKSQNLIGIMNTCTVIYLSLNYGHWVWNRLRIWVFFLVGGVVLLAIGVFLEKARKSTKLG
ncbi:MAG: DUF2157 domain-containing protein [Alphaproteobacteria bacterium]|nr:DUF2157 domain-containing protein [Alphaproteobacteria bacterium]